MRYNIITTYYQLLSLLVFTATTLVNGDYTLEITTHLYSNPTNRCVSCGQNQGCCDDSDSVVCTGELRCDSYFYYCIRETPSRSEDYYSHDCDGGKYSSVNPDGAAIDYSQDTVLGLPNPLPLNVPNTLIDIQLFIAVIDFNGVREPTKFIDKFLVNLGSITTATVGVESNPLTVNGVHGFGTIQLSFRLVCATNYDGRDCSQFCATGNCTCPVGFTGEQCKTNIDDCEGISCYGNGYCVDAVNSFQCICNSGYTGRKCKENIDDCADVTCFGNGHCEDGVDSFTCVCNSGFTGQLCEINIDNCIGVDCSGNGHCEDGIDSYQCSCYSNSGFTGSQCETNINDCAEVTCSGNGRCVDGVNTFTCICISGFIGQLCETNIDDCIGVDCSGNGRCVDGVNTFTCICISGFNGQLCETNIDDCIGVDCSGNGQCEDGVDSFTCVCDPDFTGQLCERKFDDCVGVDCSGNGRCEDGVASFACVCDPGFTGDLCQDIVEGISNMNGTVAPSAKDSGAVAVGGLIGGSVLIGLVLVLIVFLSFFIKRQIKCTFNRHDPDTMDINDNNAYQVGTSVIRPSPRHQAKMSDSVTRRLPPQPSCHNNCSSEEDGGVYYTPMDGVYYTPMDGRHDKIALRLSPVHKCSQTCTGHQILGTDHARSTQGVYSEETAIYTDPEDRIYDTIENIYSNAEVEATVTSTSIYNTSESNGFCNASTQSTVKKPTHGVSSPYPEGTALSHCHSGDNHEEDYIYYY